MRIAPLEKTLELDGAVFRYRIPWGAKQAYIALAHGAQSEVSPEARRMIADAQREGRELTPEEMAEVGGDSVIDVAKAVDIFFSHRCLTGWDGVMIVDDEGNEKPLPFSHENAKEYLPGEAIVALAMDALMRVVESSGKLTRLREQAERYARGQEIIDPEPAIQYDMLLRRYPGYRGVDDLLNEHAEVIDAFLVIAEAEGRHQEAENRKLEAQARHSGRR